MKKKFIIFASVQSGIFILIALCMIIIDPYFHYHKPLKCFQYRLLNERYINNGILRNFEYDSLIIGTSMTQNFKTSEAEELFGGTFVKVPYAGAGFLELAAETQLAIDSNPKLTDVYMCLDYLGLRRDKDYVAYSDVPEYMYDDDIWNDVQYIYNKEILYYGLVNTFYRTLRKEPTTSFDEYSSWVGPTGLEHIMESYDRAWWKEQKENGYFDLIYQAEGEKKRTYENITQNLIPLIEKNPNIRFHFFYAPYCILYWDSLQIEGTMEMQLEADKMVTEMLLQYDNVELFSFYENMDLICNLDLYRNKEHYVGEVNSMILQWMANGEYRLTRENLDEYITFMYDNYPNYEYESIFTREN